ncbi:MAG: hypothetical protein AMXMBFR42_04340 [Burkholderiales bacterium]
MNPISLIDAAARTILGSRAGAAAAPVAPAAARAQPVTKRIDAERVSGEGAPKRPQEKAALPVVKSGDAARTADASASRGASTGSNEAAERFLTLLVAQLRNQDPLNPLDNAQVTTQLAQLSTVTGINRINETLLALGEAQSAARTLQAAALLGREVVVDGNAIRPGSDEPSRGGYALGAAATSVVVTIKDAAGAVVRTIDLGAHPAGVQHFGWDGKTDAGAAAAPGRYTFAVAATGRDGPVTARTMTIATVTGVDAADGGPRLVLGDLGSIGLDEVRTFN